LDYNVDYDRVFENVRYISNYDFVVKELE
jgi:hypothetical protein